MNYAEIFFAARGEPVPQGIHLVEMEEDTRFQEVAVMPDHPRKWAMMSEDLPTDKPLVKRETVALSFFYAGRPVLMGYSKQANTLLIADVSPALLRHLLYQVMQNHGRGL